MTNRHGKGELGVDGYKKQTHPAAWNMCVAELAAKETAVLSGHVSHTSNLMFHTKTVYLALHLDGGPVRHRAECQRYLKKIHKIRWWSVVAAIFLRI